LETAYHATARPHFGEDAMSSSSIHPGWITESPHVISRYQKTMPAADEPAVLEAQYPAHLRIVVTVPGVLRLQQFAPHK
jgi:hypothetical protein